MPDSAPTIRGIVQKTESKGNGNDQNSRKLTLWLPAPTALFTQGQ